MGLKLVFSVLALWASTAASAANTTIDAQAAFARLKALAGVWEMDAPQMKISVRFEVIAGGNALVEHDSMGKMEAMMTVYHLDGGRLMLTHYCITGSQPRLQLRSFDAASGDLQFEFMDATNLANPNAPHMHNLAIHIADSDHLISDWESYANGKPGETKAFKLTRAK